MPLRTTHTYALLEVSAAAYDEIAAKLREAGYDQAFMEDGEIDMHGLALVKAPAAEPTVIEEGAVKKNLNPAPTSERPPPPASQVPPVDRTKRVLTSGKTEEEQPDYRDLKPNGQQKDYVVLSEEERAKGFVRPVRRSYIHEKCGTLTTMSQSIAETYARDPHFYSGTFCAGCGAHFPVGDDGEFVWAGTDEKVGT